MKLKFDSSQEYQLKAIASIVDIFKGHGYSDGFFTPFYDPERLIPDTIAYRNEPVDEILMRKNIKSIQERNGLEVTEYSGKHFSVEMETGTGKTYVFLRTIFELNKKHGFKKFIILVPSISIREGIKHSIDILKEHFEELYDKPIFDSYIYNSDNLPKLKDFAKSDKIQIMIINIDSFNKESNKLRNYNDTCNGVPIEYIKLVNPILIIDEPQNMESDKSKEAIELLNPMCTLRYSATHKNPYNLMYSFNPIMAYNEGLVKKIGICSVTDESPFSLSYIEYENYLPPSGKGRDVYAKAELKIIEKGKNVPKKIKATFMHDLYEKSNKNDYYKDGYILEGIDRDEIKFKNGIVVKRGSIIGNDTDEIMKTQIKESIKKHLERELIIKKEGYDIKVLSLFFIDEVANYRESEDGEKGKIAIWFEECFEELSKEEIYKELDTCKLYKEDVHKGYFSGDKKSWKNTGGSSENDISTYELIMKKKERLLDKEEKTRFIFSHSALKEGWDNPNIFQICVLRDVKNSITKRQQVGRGLRLAVNSDGERVFDRKINQLVVIANESFNTFVENLQSEIEKDTGFKISQERFFNANKKRVTVKKNKNITDNIDFKNLWEKISFKTKYSVNYDTKELIEKASKYLKEDVPDFKSKILIQNGVLETLGESVIKSSNSFEHNKKVNILNILEILERETRVTKNSLKDILIKSGILEKYFENPDKFIEYVSKKVKYILNKEMVEGIQYKKIEGFTYEMTEFKDFEELLQEELYKVKNIDKTVYDYIQWDSTTENEFAKHMDNRDDIKFYFKLPNWFKIPTPVGNYNPDWAIVYQEGTNKEKIYLVRETKSTGNTNEIEREKLREKEVLKIKCAEEHFKLEETIDYGVIKSGLELQIKEKIQIVDTAIYQEEEQEVLTREEEIAVNLLKNGVSIDIIKISTNLTEERIKQLQQR